MKRLGKFAGFFLLISSPSLLLIPGGRIAAQQTRFQHIPDPEREVKSLLVQGQTALDKKDYAAAADIFRKYLAQKPDDAYAHFQLGYAYTALQQFDEAKDEYGKAASLDPGMAAAHLNLGLILLDKDPAAAVEPLRKAAELLPDQARPRFFLGWALERANQLDGAIKEYEQAERLDAKNFDIHLSLARALLASNRAPEAEAEFRSALAIKPDSSPAHLGLAESLVAQKKTEPAAEELAKYLSQHPEDSGSRVQLASILLDAGKPTEALAQLDQAAAAGPEALAALKLRAEIAMRQKKYDAAAAALQKALALAPHDEDLRARLGHALLESRDYQGALRELTEALRSNPEDPDILRDWMAAQYLSSNYEAALAALDLLAKRETPTDRTWFIRATCYDKLGRKEDAVDSYQKFLSLHASTNDDDYFVATARVRTLTRELKEKKK